MSLAVLLFASIATGTAAGVLARRSHRRPAVDVARRVGEAAAGHQLPSRMLRADADRATGLALSAAALILIAGGVVFALLAYLVRSDSRLVELDRSVADWGGGGGGTAVVRAISDAAVPVNVCVLAGALGIVLAIRARSITPALFLLVVVGGNAVLTTTIKQLADRVRPELNPIAETLGPSFPSGHSSYAAAFLAAAALLLGRGRSPGERALLAGGAVGLAVAVASSRVLLDEHWLSDVVAGLALGWAWFAACSLAFGGRLLRFGTALRAARKPLTQRPRARSR